MELHSWELACPEDLLGREWLEPNGRAGYACGTLAWTPRRRFHGLLCIARRPPTDRTMLVNHLQETFQLGSRSYELAIDPAKPVGARCVGYSSWPWPRWTFDLDGSRLTREVICPDDRDAVLIRYQLEDPRDDARLLARPALTGRPAEGVLHGRRAAPEEQSGPGWARWALPSDLVVHARFPGRFSHHPTTRHVHFDIDQERGEPHAETWFEPGTVELELDERGETWICFSAGPQELEIDAEVARERARREAWTTSDTGNDALSLELPRSTLAMVTRTQGGRVLLAGYPWFEAWGRDTFTSLPGVCLVTGHFDVAKETLALYAERRARGMIPQRLPPLGDEPGYEAVDTSLWFIRAAYEYLRYTGDDDFVRETCWPAVREVLEAYSDGAPYGIHADSDGLLLTTARQVKLTWMDAAYQHHVFTPRQGKPVEVQALWLNGLGLGASLAERFGDMSHVRAWSELRNRGRKSFEARFWYPEGGYLHDVVDGAHGDDPRLRPNQLFAFAFEEPLASRERAQRVLEVVEARLLTPLGLRTLPRDDPDYHPRYVGPRSKRDPAYHNGTVWPYLLAPYVKTLLYVRGRSPETRKHARGLLAGLAWHLKTGCVGHLPEIFDADPPHLRRGCFAQAWSSGELLLTLAEELREERPRPRRGDETAAPMHDA